MAWALGTDRGGVAARLRDPLGDDTSARYERFLEARERRVPFQHVTGFQEFRGLPIAVDPRVLVPRPETEEVVEAALGFLPEDAEGPVADLGTGSGCIAVALAVERPRLRVLALDRSPEAVEVARGNAARHGVSDRIELVVGDFAAPPPSWRSRAAVVVSNPPYVSRAEWEALEPEVRDHEPRAALVPGETGHEAYAALAPAAFDLLAPGGVLVLELGWKSAAAAEESVARSGFRGIEIRPDLAGIARILVARR